MLLATQHRRVHPLNGSAGGGVRSACRSLDPVVQPISRSSALSAIRKDWSKMPKLKTKSGAKKRFKMTGTGKVKAQAQGKRHGMIKRTAKFVRSARGTMVLNDSDAKIVKKYMPYNR
jgi:large subunit ribosomal protein L35